jgi:N-acetylglutamate synthase-like GNAT family acetyltransferase
MPSVLVIGEALIDVVHGINGEIRNIPGGSQANTAVALARLGIKTYMKARTSSDQFGTEIRKYLTNQDVNLDYSLVADSPSSVINAFIQNNKGVFIACGRLQENENKIGQIRFMAVDQNYQGKGLGKLIITSLEEKAKDLQLNKIQLQARENAVSFYKNNGYVMIEKTFLLWDQIQHFLMEKNVI